MCSGFAKCRFHELAQIYLAVETATTILFILFAAIVPLPNLFESDLPRSIPLIDGILVLLTTGGLRYNVRFAERLRQRKRNHSPSSTRASVIGAGDAGVMIAREMQANPRLGLEPAVFLDDDPQKHGMWIHSVPVAGGRQKILDVASGCKVQQTITVVPTAPGKVIRELMRLCWRHIIRMRLVKFSMRPTGNFTR